MRLAQYIQIFLIVTFFVFNTSCGEGKRDKKSEGKEDEMSFVLKSSSFKNGERIPVKHTCEGEDISPQLTWEGVPQGTKSFALICDDPDAPMGTWVHWVVYNIPDSVNSLPEGVEKADTVFGYIYQGRNSFGRIGYGGPCPPRGPAHRYFFKLYALDFVPALKAGATKEQVLNAISGHILGTAELMGIYSR